MILNLLKNAEWKPFLQLLSPSFFDVVPTGLLLGEAKKFRANYFDRSKFSEAKALRRQTLASSHSPVEISETFVRPSAVPAAAVLELYFHQVLSGGLVLLDHRRERFAMASQNEADCEPDGEAAPKVMWSPAPLYSVFDGTFERGIRDLYAGFYHDKAELFSAGAHALGLGAVQNVLHAQFGEGDQTRVRFSLRTFQQRFYDVFVACKATKSELHPGFIPLGIGLATLYSHLDEAGDEHDVRSAYLRASA